MIGIPGSCTVCDKPIVENGRMSPDFSEVEVLWSNGSKMKVGVCKSCATDHTWATSEGKKAITDWHFTHWDMAHVTYDKEVILV